MKQITIILIGTIHDTKNETKLFKYLNKIATKNIHWLCEGEKYGRNCESIKNNNIHLLTDALFVNMMIIDFNNDREFIDEFYGRVAELFITMSKFDNLNILPTYQKIIDLIKKGNLELVYKNLKLIDINVLKSDLKKIILKLLNYAKNNNMIDKNFEKCILEFYETGIKCENEILTIMREKSFINIILDKINNLSDEKHIIIVTVGMDHCDILKQILVKFDTKVEILKYD